MSRPNSSRRSSRRGQPATRPSSAKSSIASLRKSSSRSPPELTAIRRAGQVSTLRTLEKDNAKLQRRVETYEQQHANAELLKETNRSLEKKLKQAESLKQQVAAQAVELEILKREKADW